jgi:hypothetical protein
MMSPQCGWEPHSRSQSPGLAMSGDLPWPRHWAAGSGWRRKRSATVAIGSRWRPSGTPAWPLRIRMSRLAQLSSPRNLVHRRLRNCQVNCRWRSSGKWARLQFPIDRARQSGVHQGTHCPSDQRAQEAAPAPFGADVQPEPRGYRTILPDHMGRKPTSRPVVGLKHSIAIFGILTALCRPRVSRMEPWRWRCSKGELHPATSRRS